MVHYIVLRPPKVGLLGFHPTIALDLVQVSASTSSVSTYTCGCVAVLVLDCCLHTSCLFTTCITCLFATCHHMPSHAPHASTDPIGALPPALGKRSLETFRELGRVAVAQMKYVAIVDEDPAPKRGKGEAKAKATEQGRGQGQAFAIFPRGDRVSCRPRTRWR